MSKKREKKQIDKQKGLTDDEKEVLKRGIDKRPGAKRAQEEKPKETRRWGY